MSDQSTLAPVARPIEAFCSHYGCTRTWAYQQLAAGTLEAVKIGRRTAILTDSAERLFAKLPRATFRAPRQDTAA